MSLTNRNGQWQIDPAKFDNQIGDMGSVENGIAEIMLNGDSRYIRMAQLLPASKRLFEDLNFSQPSKLWQILLLMSQNWLSASIFDTLIMTQLLAHEYS